MTAKEPISLVCRDPANQLKITKMENGQRTCKNNSQRKMCLKRVKYYKDSPKGNIVDTDLMTALWVI